MTETPNPKILTIAKIRGSKVIKPAEYSWTWLWFFIPVSMPFTVIFARLGAGPNTATLVRVGVSVVSLGMMCSISPGIFWAGVALFYFGIVLDFSDGDLARSLDMASHAGKSFDGIMDVAVELPLMLVIAVHFWRLGGDPLLLVAAATSAIAVAVVLVAVFRSGMMDRDVDAQRSANTAVRRTSHPKLDKLRRWLAAPLNYIEGRAYYHVWDLRFGGLLAALLLGWPEIWIYLIAAVDASLALMFVPARIVRGFVENDVHRKSKSSAPAQSD